MVIYIHDIIIILRRRYINNNKMFFVVKVCNDTCTNLNYDTYTVTIVYTAILAKKSLIINLIKTNDIYKKK